MNSPLEHFARRMEKDAFYLAAPLARYAHSHRLNDDALAADLGCDLYALTHLRLCRNPNPMPPHFWEDIQHIAQRFHLDPEKLAEIVRFGQALSQSILADSSTVDEQPGYLMAARDEDTAPTEESPP